VVCPAGAFAYHGEMKLIRASARLLPIVLLSAVSMHALAQAPPAEKPVHFGTWGVDLAGAG
jgi:hypothetical protein